MPAVLAIFKTLLIRSLVLDGDFGPNAVAATTATAVLFFCLDIIDFNIWIPFSLSFPELVPDDWEETAELIEMAEPPAGMDKLPNIGLFSFFSIDKSPNMFAAAVTFGNIGNLVVLILGGSSDLLSAGLFSSGLFVDFSFDLVVCLLVGDILEFVFFSFWLPLPPVCCCFGLAFCCSCLTGCWTGFLIVSAGGTTAGLAAGFPSFPLNSFIFSVAFAWPAFLRKLMSRN